MTAEEREFFAADCEAEARKRPLGSALRRAFQATADHLRAASCDRNAKRHDREAGHGPKDESAVGDSRDAPK